MRRDSRQRWAQTLHIIAQRLIEFKFPLRSQRDERGGGEHLGSRAEPEKHLRRHGRACLDAGDAVAFDINHPTVFDHRDGGAGRVAFLHSLVTLNTRFLTSTDTVIIFASSGRSSGLAMNSAGAFCSSDI